MEKTAVQKLAQVLRTMILIVFACDLLALIFVPFLVDQQFLVDLDSIASTFRYDFDDGLAIFFDTAYYQVWRQPYTFVLTLFLWACGICAAVILWQGKCVLDTILEGEPFTLSNAQNLKRAAVCCFLIAGAALARLIWGLAYYRSIAPLHTYNALFVPIFFMAGLLCLVMSALFRQAAELKEDQDLTI